MTRRMLTGIVFTILGFLPAAAQSEVRCESQLAGYTYCRGETSQGVRLVQQLDRHSCIQNDTWGFDANGVWVANGCRATFQMGSAQPQSGSSGLGGALLGVFGLGTQKPQQAAAPAAPPAAQTFAAPPPPAAAEPKRYGARAPQYGNAAVAVMPPQAPLVRCESAGAQQRCPAYFRSHVELYRKLAPAECRFNVTWGYAYGLVWVDKGCRADFALY